MLRLKNQDGDKPSVLLPLFLIWVLWGIVPGCAKLSGIPGDLLTLWVNWIAVFSLLLIILVNKQWVSLIQDTDRNPLGIKDYLKVSALGFFWPFLYSLAFFGAIYEKGPAFTTILAYSFPIFALLSRYIIFKKKIASRYYIGICLAIIGVGVGVYLGNDSSITLIIPVICMGLFAGMSQGVYISITSEWQKYSPWLITLGISIVTAIYATIWVSIYGHFYIPSPKSILFAAIIGVLGNALGFLVYTYGNQLADKSDKEQGVWLSGLCFILIAQFIFSIIVGTDSLNPYYGISIILITVGLFINVNHRK